MAGIAIIIKDADFSQSGLGTVTPFGQSQEQVPVQVTDGLTHDYDAFGANSNILTDKLSNATIAFDGSYSDNYVSLNSSTNESIPVDAGSNTSRANCGAMVDGLYEWTLEIVTKTQGWTALQDSALYGDYGREANGKIQVHLGINGKNGAGAYIRRSGSWVFGAMPNANSAVDYSLPHVFHIVRINQNNSSTTFKFYVDGILVDTVTIQAYFATSAKASDVVHGTGQRWLYAVRSYNRELTQQEIQTNCDFNASRYNF